MLTLYPRIYSSKKINKKKSSRVYMVKKSDFARYTVNPYSNSCRYGKGYINSVKIKKESNTAKHKPDDRKGENFSKFSFNQDKCFVLLETECLNYD